MSFLMEVIISNMSLDDRRSRIIERNTVVRMLLWFLRIKPSQEEILHVLKSIEKKDTRNISLLPYHLLDSEILN
jgi:hypothetical protein